MTRIQGREGSYPKVSCLFFKAVIYANVSFQGRDVGHEPPYGAVPGQLPAKGLATAHREAAKAEERGDMGIYSASGSDGGRGIQEYRVYITRRQNTVAQYIATQPILDLCERSFRRPGAWVSWRWRKQEGIDLEG